MCVGDWENSGDIFGWWWVFTMELGIWWMVLEDLVVVVSALGSSQSMW